tara:strand:+ start:428 stop:1867 length:1440 start_codon:yes stop_codon:yes gene_type:complete
MSDLGNRANVNSAIDLLLDDLQPDEAIQPSDHNTLLKNILDTLANGLSVTLRTGNTTSGQNVEITAGDSIDFGNSGFLGSLVPNTLTANRQYDLPDTTGTIALLSDIPSADNIYTADGTIGTNRVATITDSLRFRDLSTSLDVVKINGSGEFELSAGGSIYGKMFTNGKWALGGSTTIGSQSGITLHKNTLIKSESDSSSNIAFQVTDTSNSGFFRIYGDKRLLFGNTSFVSTENISLQKPTAIKGIGTSGSSALAIYDNDTTPNKLWDFLDNGNVNLGSDSSVVLSGNNLTFDCGTTGKFVINGSNTTENQVFTFQHNGNTSFLLTKEGKIQNTDVFGNDVLDMTNISKTSGIILNTSLAQVFSPQLLFRKSTSDANGVRITTSSTSEETKWQRTSSLNYVHQIKSGTTTNIVNFFNQGWSNSQGLIVGSGAKVGSEDISLQGDTLLNENVNMPNLPTSATGLSSGDLWNDGGTVKIA